VWRRERVGSTSTEVEEVGEDPATVGKAVVDEDLAAVSEASVGEDPVMEAAWRRGAHGWMSGRMM
jgi:hypothetical protein